MIQHEEVPDVHTLQTQIRYLEHEIAGLRTDVRDLVEAWNTARGLVKAVRLIGAIAFAFGAVFALIKTSWGRP